MNTNNSIHASLINDNILEQFNENFFVESGNVGIGGSPNADAKLDIQSTTGAVLFPRMTTTQRDALTAVAGMVVYNSSTNKLQVYNDSSWVDLNA